MFTKTLGQRYVEHCRPGVVRINAMLVCSECGPLWVGFFKILKTECLKFLPLCSLHLKLRGSPTFDFELYKKTLISTKSMAKNKTYYYSEMICIDYVLKGRWDIQLETDGNINSLLIPKQTAIIFPCSTNLWRCAFALDLASSRICAIRGL